MNNHQTPKYGILELVVERSGLVLLLALLIIIIILRLIPLLSN